MGFRGAMDILFVCSITENKTLEACVAEVYSLVMEDVGRTVNDNLLFRLEKR